MNHDVAQQLVASADRLAGAAETLDRVLSRMDAHQEAMNAKVDRIVAAVEERVTAVSASGSSALESRIAELEKANEDLKAQAARSSRKTLSPLTSAVLSKSSVDGIERMDAAAIDKSLQALSVEQRIAVKAEMARAGLID